MALQNFSAETAAYVDEEDCLGFKIWVAELELIIGSSRGKKKADAVQSFLLLQKLVVTLDRTDRLEIREYQRRCEDALIDILLKGAPPPVRRLICEALGKLYARGDQLPLFSRVSSLQLFLGTKEAFGRETAEDVRLGALELMTSLYYSQGRSLSIGVSETSAIAVKYCAKGSSDRTRRAALRLMAAAAEGVGGSHRNAVVVQTEALKAVERLLKERDLGESVKLGIADVFRAVASTGGAQLWANSLAAYHFAHTACLHGLHDASPAVRAAYARALGEIATASTSEDAKLSIPAAGVKPRYQLAQETALAAVVNQCLATPFADAVASSSRSICTALAQAWVFHLTATRLACGVDEAAFIEPAMKPIEAMKAACVAAEYSPEKGPSGGETELGMGIGGGERPHAQACLLYIMRAGVIEQLGESGQRRLLERITAELAPPPSISTSTTTTTTTPFSATTITAATTSTTSAATEEGEGTATTAAPPPPVSTTSQSSQLQPSTVTTPVFIICLELVALLAEALGEVGPEAAASLEAAIFAKLVGPHAALRVQAASALAAVAVAEPARAGRLMGSALMNLRGAADAVVDASALGPDKSKPGPGTPRGPGSNRLKPDMNVLHGWALASAALVAATSRLPLGVPSHYIKVAVQLAAALIEAPRTQFAAAMCLEREAGFTMLCVLCHVALPEVTAVYDGGGGSVLSLWKPALGEEPTTALDAAFKSRESYADSTLAAELWWRTAAVQALTALIQATNAAAEHSPSSSSSSSGGGGSSQSASASAMSEELTTSVLGLLRPLLTMLSTHTALRHPSQAKGGSGAPLAGAAGMMQLRLLQAYSCLAPAAIVAAGDGEALSSLSLDALKAAATGPLNTGALIFLSPALQSVLDAADSHLGPWGGGRDPLERALLQFEGAAGGPQPPAWQIGLRAGVGYAVDSAGATQHAQHTTGSIYPQSSALGPALFAAQVQILGAVLRALPPAAQNDILDALLALAKSFPPAAKKDRDAQKRLVAVLVAAVPVLGAFGSSSSSSGSTSVPTTTDSQISEKILSLAEAATAEAAAGVLPQRAGAGLYAAAARLSGDTPSVQLIKKLCQQAAQTSSLPQRAALALSVGDTSLAVGGMGLATVLPLAVQTLAALAGASDSSIAPTLLHALMTCSQAAGLSFVPHVKPTLTLMQNMLLSEDIYAVPGLLPAVGRLANGMVAALGPDYVLGSAAYDACRSVVAELRAPDASGVRRPEDSLAASLQSVLYAQMLVLFAPRALPAAQHVAVLVGTLPSRQPQLRKAAADTLRHLAERDATAVLAEQIEPGLLAALDGETDPATSAQLQATLSTLLEAGAAQEPSRWIALCGEIISAAGPADASGGSSSSSAMMMKGGAALNSGGGDDGDDDEDEDSSASTTTAAAAAGGRNSSKTIATSSTTTIATTPPTQQQQQAALTPRLRTRIFAAGCLLRVPGMAAAADPLHTDLERAQADAGRGGGGDWLVLRLQVLIDLGFKMATGQLEALRPLGVDLMLAVLIHLGDVADPLAEEVEGARLLAQYQAQYVSTLRASLAAEASPEVGASGAALAAAFLEKGLAAGDAVVMERLMALLCAPLTGWAAGGADPAQAAYSEWVAARARVALLESHAHCAASVTAGGDEAAKQIILRAQGPFLTLLVECWIGLLHDYAVFSGHTAALLKPQQSRRHAPKIAAGGDSSIPTPEGGEEEVAVTTSVSEPPKDEESSSSSSSYVSLASYKLALYGKGTATSRAIPLSVVASGIGPALRRAWPAVLEASTLTMMHDRTVSYGPSGKERHVGLIDSAMAAVQWALHGDTHDNAHHHHHHNSSSSGDCLGCALRALQRLTASRFAKEGWLSPSTIAEVAAVTADALRCSTSSSPLLTPSALEAAAMTLEQLSAIAEPGSNDDDGDSAEEMIVQGVDACLAAAVKAQSKSTSAVSAALTALTHRLSAAATVITTRGGDGGYAALLQLSLAQSLRVIQEDDGTAPYSSCCSAEQAPIAASHILSTTKAAVLLQHHHHHHRNHHRNVSLSPPPPPPPPSTNDAQQDHDHPSIGEILTAAAATAAQQAQQSASAAAALSSISDGAPQRAAANLASALALGAFAVERFSSLAPLSTEIAEETGESAIENKEEEEEEETLFLEGSSGVIDEDEWGDAEFTSATSPAPLQTPLTPPAPTATSVIEISPTQHLCLEALRGVLSSPSPAVRLYSTQTLTSFLHGHPPPLWAAQCAAVGIPPAFAALHALLHRQLQLPISDPLELQAAAETLKCGVMVCNLGGDVGAAALKVVVPVMVETAAPPGEPTPALSDAAVKLLVALASGSSATAFRSAVAGLPEDTRRRLQRALASVASAAAPAVGTGAVKVAAVGPQKLPSIQLKKFSAA